MRFDDVRLMLIVSVSKLSVVVPSSSLSKGSSEDVPVTPIYSEESSCSSLLIGSKVVSRNFSVEKVSSNTISLVTLSDKVASGINGVDASLFSVCVVSTDD